MSWALTQLLTSLPPPPVIVPRTCWRKGPEADSFAMLGLGDIRHSRVAGPGQGPKCCRVEGFHGEGNTAFLTRRGKKEGLGCARSPSPPAQGFGEGVHLSTHGAPIWAGPGRMLVSRTAFMELGWVNRHYSRAVNKCI